jgi:hypothetical protein
LGGHFFELFVDARGFLASSAWQDYFSDIVVCLFFRTTIREKNGSCVGLVFYVSSFTPV